MHMVSALRIVPLDSRMLLAKLTVWGGRWCPGGAGSLLPLSCGFLCLKEIPPEDSWVHLGSLAMFAEGRASSQTAGLWGMRGVSVAWNNLSIRMADGGQWRGRAFLSVFGHLLASGRCFAFIFTKGGETRKKKSKLYAKVWQKALKWERKNTRFLWYNLNLLL